MIRICCLACIVVPSIQQIAKDVRLQPWPIKVGSIVGKCCNEHNASVSASLLVDCISPLRQANNKRNVALVSYAHPFIGQHGIADITSFSAYQEAITQAYAEHNGYSYRVMDEKSGSNYDPDDARWNKVKIISEALNGWASHVEYICWIGQFLM